MADFRLSCVYAVWSAFLVIACATYWAATALYIMLVITTKTYNNDIHVVDDIWLMRPLDLAAAQHNAVTESLVKSW